MRRAILSCLAFALATVAWAAPGRVVSVGGGITEIVYALGMGSRVVGVDDTSDYPAAAQTLPKVGYARTLSAEGLLSLNPSLILTTDEAGPAAALTQVERAGVRVVRVASDHSLDGVYANIRRVARSLGVAAKGEALVLRLSRDATSLAWRGRRVANPVKVMFILQTGGGSPLVAGRGTAADAMIALAGGQNAVSAYTGYKPLTPEAVLAQAPDVVLVTTQGLAMMGGAAGVWRTAGLVQTPAGQAGRLVHMDTMYLLGFGPRTVEAAGALHTALYPRAKR